ncbi:lasso peptide biosynthesis B2 protein [Paenibacillus roseipurpureus]|uniref:Lasso peptide biosynthesis B2 protein n=1 Tax=Paenibacillus roseopurpureus TaxID=2918901 RepID=A0AA96LMH0_9BACL|nr:lasso peptide biosynthesis B2 protein [Paenibacillus sp. MBLB1832]WNR43812.1 lasso peptide biosynthesis B2 protein [Paenibacillus sp. MBLB1832]
MFQLDTTTMLLFMEAYMYLGWARILKSLPFARVVQGMGLEMGESPLEVPYLDKRVVAKVAVAVQTMSSYTIWDSKCLVRALTGMKMLSKRKMHSTLYLGTAKDEHGRMIAHAWLRCGPYYVTGAEEMKRFTVVGTFTKR